MHTHVQGLTASTHTHTCVCAHAYTYVQGLTARPSVNPEEAVALGAAVMAGVMDGKVNQKMVNPYAHARVVSRRADNPNA